MEWAGCDPAKVDATSTRHPTCPVLDRYGDGTGCNPVGHHPHEVRLLDAGPDSPLQTRKAPFTLRRESGAFVFSAVELRAKSLEQGLEPALDPVAPDLIQEDADDDTDADPEDRIDHDVPPMVAPVGFAPTRPKTLVSETSASTVPP